MAAGDPTGLDLVSGTTNGDTLPVPWPPDDPEEREITFGAGIELTSGVTYAIVVRASDAVDADDSALWEMKSAGGYANGAHYYSNDGGSSWTVNSTADVWFKTLAVAAEKDSFTFAASGGGAWLYGTAFWSAQTFIASSTYTITSVKLHLYRVNGSTPGTITVSIRATEGAPTKATTPAPANAASDVTLDQATLTWVDGGGATSYNVYYGDTSGALTLVSSGQAGLSFTVTGITLGSPYAYITTRYWRIDSINAAGTTAGDEWSFTTIDFDQLRVTYELISGGSGYGPYDATPGVEGTDFRYTGENNMITVRRLIGIANNKFWFEDT